MPDDSLPILSLFSGAGGLDWGFQQEHFRVALALDNFPAAVKSYNLNSTEEVAREADLSSVTEQDVVNLLGKTAPGIVPCGIIGGPPCQGFSRGNAGANPDDPRNLLPFRYAALLAALNKRYTLRFFVFENVMGLLTPRHADKYNAIQEQFKAAGFTLFQQPLNASAFGVPQNRPRLFVVGLNSALFPNAVFTFPNSRAKRKTVRDAIAGLPPPAFFERGLKPENIPHHPNHWTMKPKSPKLTTAPPTDGRSFRRLSWGEASPVVAYGNREIHVHPDGGRRLSVHEAMLLQGFPSRYCLAGNFSEQITQVSNAVPPPVARALARAVRSFLRAQHQKDRKITR